MVCDKRSCKRIQRNGEQEKSIEKHETRIGFSDKVEHVVVIYPHDQDREEACKEGEERGPLVDQSLEEIISSCLHWVVKP